MLRHWNQSNMTFEGIFIARHMQPKHLMQTICDLSTKHHAHDYTYADAVTLYRWCKCASVEWPASSVWDCLWGCHPGRASAPGARQALLRLRGQHCALPCWRPLAWLATSWQSYWRWFFLQYVSLWCWCICCTSLGCGVAAAWPMGAVVELA